MPVIFEQPSPMAPDIVSAAGAAHQFSQDAPMLARLYESQMQGQTQASIAAAHLSQAAAASHAQTVERGTASQDALAEQGREFDVNRFASPRDAFHAQAAMALQQQHTENQAWLQAQGVSQMEKLDYQRTQNAVAAIHQGMNDFTIDKETGNALITQARTRMDPVKARLERERANFEQEQIKKVQHADAQEEVRRSESNKFWAKNAPDGSLYIDENGNFVDKDYAGHKRTFVRNHAGDPVEVGQQKGGDVDGKREEAVLERLTKYEEHALDMGAKQLKSDLDAWNVKRQATIAADKPDPGPMPGAQDVGSYMRSHLEAMPGYQDLRAKLEAMGKGRQQPPQTPPGSNPPIGGPPNAAPPPAVPPGTPPKVANAIVTGDPLDGATVPPSPFPYLTNAPMPGYESGLQQIARNKGLLSGDDPRLSDAQRNTIRKFEFQREEIYADKGGADLIGFVDAQQKLIQRYGSEEAMPTEQRQAFNTARTSLIRRLIKTGKQEIADQKAEKQRQYDELQKKLFNEPQPNLTGG